MWYLIPGSVGTDKFEIRWQEGAWLGIRDESAGVIRGTNSGMIKAKGFRREGMDSARWKKDQLNELG